MPVPLRPLSLADRLDGALRILKLAPGVVLPLTLAAVVPVELLAAATLRGDDDRVARAFFGAPMAALLTDDTGAGPAAPIAFFLLDALALAFVTAGLTTLVSGWHVGRRHDARSLLRGSARRLPTLAAAVLLVHVVEAVAALGLVLGVFVPMTLYAVVAPVVAAEGTGAWKALGRAFQLARRSFSSVLGTVVLVGVVSIIVRAALAALAGAYADAGLPAGWLVVTAMGIAVRLVTEPLVGGCAVLLYLDLRVRHEGLDLELAIPERLPRAQ